MIICWLKKLEGFCIIGTLCFIVSLRQDFFPNGSIMEAKDSRRGSYSWKSILKGMDVIAWGACWWIGNGKSVKI